MVVELPAGGSRLLAEAGPEAAVVAPELLKPLDRPREHRPPLSRLRSMHTTFFKKDVRNSDGPDSLLGGMAVQWMYLRSARRARPGVT
eukprot:scaffold126885_cov15-Prasinocladus_malaysianus.AAC.1